jgi:glycosyltransferase involved in cell wall biosynthesis
MRIAALEPYAAISHLLFLEGLVEHSSHEIEILPMSPRAWKWRMRTASMHYAEVLAEREPFDLWLVSDYLNLPELLALLPASHRDTPVVVYFHENQLTYPLQETERRDHHFAFTHFHSILAARHTLFNSHYHRGSFFEALATLLRLVPDIDMRPSLRAARQRSSVLPLGTDVPRGELPRCDDGVPIVLWNHRWEYDKGPELLLETMRGLKQRGEAFRLRVLGQSFRERPEAIEALGELLGEQLEVLGFLPERDDYLTAIREAHIVLSTAHHDFFGLATLEALRSGALGVLVDDLAYGELLPGDEGVRSRYLYPRESGAVEVLCGALQAVRRGEGIEERRAAVRFTDRFAWEKIAPRYDECFERAFGEG